MNRQMKRWLESAIFIGFTGTPLLRRDKVMTRDVFPPRFAWASYSYTAGSPEPPAGATATQSRAEQSRAERSRPRRRDGCEPR